MTKTKKGNNYAFIDSQNVNLSVQEEGWKLDWKRFYVFLQEKCVAKKIYIFIGYMPKNQRLYSFLENIGYTIIFKEVLNVNGKTKGNVDAELVLQSMVDYSQYDKAILVSSDGDFACLVNYLNDNDKLLYVLSPNIKKCSYLIKKSAKEKLRCLTYIKNKLSYK